VQYFKALLIKMLVESNPFTINNSGRPNKLNFGDNFGVGLKRGVTFIAGG
jgi:hypothetical protein